MKVNQISLAICLSMLVVGALLAPTGCTIFQSNPTTQQVQADLTLQVDAYNIADAAVTKLYQQGRISPTLWADAVVPAFASADTTITTAQNELNEGQNPGSVGQQEVDNSISQLVSDGVTWAVLAIGTGPGGNPPTPIPVIGTVTSASLEASAERLEASNGSSLHSTYTSDAALYRSTR